MGRKEKKVVETTRAENKAAMGGFEQQILGEIQGIPTDYTPEQKAAIRRARLGGTEEGYQLAEDAATRRFTRTGATAGYNELLAEMAREKTREKSRAGAELETGFADEPIRRRLLRAGLLKPLYGTRAGLYSQTIPSPGSTDRGWWESWGRDLLEAGTSAASSAALACWVADALYGESSGKTLLLRYWINQVFPNWWTGRVFLRTYLNIGQPMAALVRRFACFDVVMRKLFDALHRKALAEVEA